MIDWLVGAALVMAMVASIVDWLRGQPASRKPVCGPLHSMRARKGYGFCRQESGQIIFRYDDETTGRSRVRRVPKTIVSMDEAVEWIRVNHYGAQPKPDDGPTRETKLFEAMVARVFDESTTIDEKRNAALAAVRLLRKYDSTAEIAGVKVKV